MKRSRARTAARKDGWLTQGQAARKLGMTTATFLRLVRLGRLPQPGLRSSKKTMRWQRSVIEGASPVPAEQQPAPGLAAPPVESSLTFRLFVSQ